MGKEKTEEIFLRKGEFFFRDYEIDDKNGYDAMISPCSSDHYAHEVYYDKSNDDYSTFEKL